MSQNTKESVEEMVIQATNNFIKIVSTNEIKENYRIDSVRIFRNG